MRTPPFIVGQQRDGYVYLLMVLFVGIIALTVLGSYMVLSVTALQSSRSVNLSMQALSNAHTCIERAILSLQADVSYGGDETLSLSNGNCTLEVVGGAGSEDRTICATGVVSNSSRRIEVYVNRIYPTVQIQSWREVTSFSYCS